MNTKNDILNRQDCINSMLDTIKNVLSFKLAELFEQHQADPTDILRFNLPTGSTTDIIDVVGDTFFSMLMNDIKEMETNYPETQFRPFILTKRIIDEIGKITAEKVLQS